MTPLEYAKKIAYSSESVLMFTYDTAVKYKDTPGVYVECGVAAGAQIIAMAAGAPNKTIYAFDSFEGIPLPSNKDDQMPGIKFLSKEEQSKLPNPGEQVLESSGATSVSESDFWEHICLAFNTKVVTYDVNPFVGVVGLNIRVEQGWFEEVLPKFDCPRIDILRLDGDLYNSTYVCLKYLYPKVMKGGIVIVDDWALPGCQQAVIDYIRDNLNAEHSAPILTTNMRFIKDENSTVAYWTK